MNKKISMKKVCLIIVGYTLILLTSWVGIQQYVIQKNPQLAVIEKYKRELSEDPTNSIIRRDLANEYIQLFEQTKDKSFLIKAKNEYEKIVELNPNNPNFRYNLATTLQKLDENEAIIQFKEILKLDSLDVSANYELGLYYSGKQDYDIAISHFQTCLKRDPTAADVYFELGVIYEKNKDSMKALQMYETTKKYDPMFEGIDKKLEILSKSKEDRQ